MEILLILLIIGLVLWFYGRQILMWVLQRWVRKQFEQHTEQKKERNPNHSSSTSSQKPNSTPGVKMNMSDITKKKFEKDQGEYVDFEEEK